MANIIRLEIFGPVSTLKRIPEVMYEQTPHSHYFRRDISEGQSIRVFIYEDNNTAVHCSRCVTCIVSEDPSAIRMEIADVGKQSGFRGSQEPDEQPVYEQLMDFILDFSKQYGLTVQERTPELEEKEEQ